MIKTQILYIWKRGGWESYRARVKESLELFFLFAVCCLLSASPLFSFKLKLLYQITEPTDLNKKTDNLLCLPIIVNTYLLIGQKHWFENVERLCTSNCYFFSFSLNFWMYFVISCLMLWGAEICPAVPDLGLVFALQPHKMFIILANILNFICKSF